MRRNVGNELDEFRFKVGNMQWSLAKDLHRLTELRQERQTLIQKLQDEEREIWARIPDFNEIDGFSLGLSGPSIFGKSTEEPVFILRGNGGEWPISLLVAARLGAWLEKTTKDLGCY